MENKIEIAKIVNTIGLKGELKVVAEQTNAQHLFQAKQIYIEGYNSAFDLAKTRQAGKHYAITLAGYNTIEQVEQFKGKNIYLDAETGFTLQQNEFFIDDLLNCNILVNNKLAKIVDIENYGAGDILVFKLDGAEMRIPFVLDFFEKIDIDNKVLVANEHFFEGAV